jgi:benzoate-CoA ligase
VRCYLSAGESLPENVYNRWREATGAPIVEGIGMTETIFMVIGGTPQDHRPGATGKPFSYTEVKLLDPEDQPVEPGSPGTLRLGSLCKDYWQQPEKTDAAFRDGWFRTGDVFVIDEEGWWRSSGPRRRSAQDIRAMGQPGGDRGMCDDSARCGGSHRRWRTG